MSSYKTCEAVDIGPKSAKPTRLPLPRLVGLFNELDVPSLVALNGLAALRLYSYMYIFIQLYVTVCTNNVIGIDMDKHQLSSRDEPYLFEQSSVVFA